MDPQRVYEWLLTGLVGCLKILTRFRAEGPPFAQANREKLESAREFIRRLLET